MAARCSRAAGGPDAADRRAYGLFGERSGWAVCGCGVAEWSHEVGVDGRQHLRIELRWGDGDPDMLRTFAKELVDLRPDALLGGSTAVTSTLASETRTIPIVFTVVADPIGSGFVASLAHPGGHITGFTAVDPAMGGKWLELLKEIAPLTVRAALLFNPSTAVPIQLFMPSIQAAASSLAVQASAAPVHAKDEIEDVIAAQARNPGGGLIVMPDTFNTNNRDLIAALAARYGVPASSPGRFCASRRPDRL